jgi:hypothetical protein
MSPKHRVTQHHYEDPAATVALPAHPARSSRGGGFEAGLLVLLGLGVAATGLALSVLPHFSSSASQIAEQLSQTGVHGDALAIGGMVLIGLALVRRAQVQRTPDESVAALQQLAIDVTLVHGEVQDVALRCDRLGGAIDALGAEIVKLRDQRPPEPPRNSSEDALFGLASSLDKLGVRLEQRLKTQQRGMQESLESLNAHLVNAQQSFADHLTAQISAQISAQLVPPPAPEPPAPLPAADASNESSLGLLDSIDDDGATQRHAQVAAAPSVDYAQLDALQHARDAAASGRTWEEELLVEPDPRRAKLDQLEQLLTDPELRALIEQMRQR